MRSPLSLQAANAHFLLQRRENLKDQVRTLPIIFKSHSVLSNEKFVDARGRLGGLDLLWDHNVTVQFLSCSLYHIDIIVHWENTTEP